MEILSYGFMMYLAIGYEILKVIFYVLGTLCFIKYLQSDSKPRSKMLRDGEPAVQPLESPAE